MPLSADREKLALDMRVTARHLFEHALAEASIDRAFQRHVDCDRGVLRICEDLHDLDSYNRVLVISIGKAAHAMVNSLEMQAGNRFEGIVASSVDPLSQVRGFRYFRGGHPLPNQESIRAAESMLKSLSAQNAASLVIFMLSGGGSSIAEKPIDDEISLEDLVATYRVLVHSGAPIAEINTIRKHLSAIKGGRMAVAAATAQQVSLLVSDVPDKTPNALASGPTMSDSTTVEECYAIAEKYGMLEQFPASVRELFQRHAFSVKIDNSCDDWDYARAADYLLERLRRLRQKSERVCLLSGGEITVKVENGGAGGRNQQFALACATRISGQAITVLSAGTDGIDGNSPAAGALVDGSTLERARARGIDPDEHLAGFNAYPFFESLGDAIMTGPTGNNLRDLRILLAY